MSAGRRSAARLILLLSLPLFVSPARSEEVRLVDEPFLDASLESSYRNWTLKKEGSEKVEVSELAVPFFIRKTLGDRADVSLLIPSISARVLGAEESSCRGPADAMLAASYIIRGRTRLGIRLGVPTGRSDPDADERAIASVAANRILRFPVRRFGEGLDAGASVVHGIALTRSVFLSAGGGLLRKGEYTYVRSGGTEGKYDPGDEAFLSCGAAGEWGRSLRFAVAADVRYRFFAVDRRDGEDFYEEGDEADLFVDAGVRFASGSRAGLRLFLAFKGDGSEEGAFGLGDIDSLATTRYLLRDLTGDYREISLSYEHPIFRRIDLTARALAGDFGDYPVPEGAGDGHLVGSARVYEVGGGLRLRVTPRLRLHVDAARLMGDAEEGAIDLSGFDLSTALHWTH
jgi:hypothetical protein